MSATYNTHHYQAIARVEKTHFWFAARSHLLKNLIRRFFTSPSSASFFEVGFGTGIVLSMVEKLGFSAVGLDVNKEAAFFAKEKTHARLIFQSIYSFRPSRQYDAVGAFDVMEHQQDDLLFLRKCADILKLHGLLFLSVPAGKWLWSDLDTYAGHKRRYDKNELHLLLTRAGFRVVCWNHWQVMTLPIFLLWRTNLARTKSRDMMKKYLRQPPGLVNVVLYWLLRLEEAFFFRVHAPMGASLIVCAQKQS